MKKLLLISCILMLTACGKVDKMGAEIFGGATKECVDGIVYLQFTSGASVAYNRDGTIKQCK